MPSAIASAIFRVAEHGVEDNHGAHDRSPSIDPLRHPTLPLKLGRGPEKNLLFEPSFDTTGVTPGGALWTARLDTSAPVRTGDVVELSVDLAEAHFFDAETTEALPVAQPAAPLAAVG
jgi:hypothetical protein